MIDPGYISEVTLQRDLLKAEDDIVTPFPEIMETNFMSYSQKYLPADVLQINPRYATAHFIVNNHSTIIARTDYNVLTYIGDVGALLGTL